jgi:Putative lumazine-binding
MKLAFHSPCRRLIVALSMLSPAAAATAQERPAPATAAATATAAIDAMRAFARAADRRDATALETLLHPAFRVVFITKPGAAPTVIERAQYLQLVRDGKLGGRERTIDIRSVAAGDGFAVGGLRLAHAAAAFKSTLTLIQVGDDWRLLQEAVIATPVTPLNPAS